MSERKPTALHIVVHGDDGEGVTIVPPDARNRMYAQEIVQIIRGMGRLCHLRESFDPADALLWKRTDEHA